jgi:ribosomal protein S18 acetylase RimI-like enzyme
MITVQDMTGAEFIEYRAMAVEHLAREESQAFERPVAEMRVSADKAFDSLLPGGGPVGPGQHLYSLRDGVRRLGYAWISLRGDRKQSAYVLDFYLDPEARGQGLAAEAFRAVEERARQLGGETISLNVFRHNTVALHLYEKVGFRIVSYLMAKPL